MKSDLAGAADTIRRALETAVLLSVGPFPGEYQLGPDKAALAALDVLLAERQQLREALEAAEEVPKLVEHFKRTCERAERIISDALAAAGEPSQDRETH